MARRSYEQYCTLAVALDIVGERWTLLIVRELMLGPKRFKDLLDGLPGIGRNLLSARLRQLEAERLIRRRELPAPAGSRVYQLTSEGRSLAAAMTELARWGLGRLGKPHPGQTFRAAWAVFPLSYTADPEAARGLHESYEFRIEGETFHLRVDDGQIRPFAGAADRPDVVATMETQTLLEIFSGDLAPAEAVATGRARIEGSPEALHHLLALYGSEPPS